MNILGFDKLDKERQNKVTSQMKHIDEEEVEKVYQDVYVNKQELSVDQIEEVPYTSIHDIDKEKMIEKAQEVLSNGEVAVLLMAGGQGTRLQHNGPKGTFQFDNISLFELQANQIKSMSDQYGAVHWYIMTSELNHAQTIQFFNDHNYFDIEEDYIHFFKQEHFPPLSKDGQILLTESADVMVTPNGNGGIFSALASSGMLDDMRAHGIEHVFMNNVDNVVVKVLDPILIGLHIDRNNEVTSKSIVPKSGESVGRLSLNNRKLGVVEYTEIPQGKDEMFKNGNIGIHVFTLDFIEKVATKKMPYHLALKKLDLLTEDLKVKKEEVLKFEKFYFDAFRYADRHHTLQVDREGEFSPLKNKEGKDSIETARKDLEALNLLK